LLNVANGDYLFFAFHDDPLKPNYVERLVDALEKNRGAVLAFCDMQTPRGVQCFSDLDGVTDRFERARRLLRGDTCWWVPNRGLFRASAARTLRGMRPNLAGEYSADWPWLLRLALIGEFVRVPEPLISKTYRSDSVSATWKRALSARLAVQFACLTALREARFPILQELQLWQERVILTLKEQWWQLEPWLRSRVTTAFSGAPTAPR
jgi:hypothetical protein